MSIGALTGLLKAILPDRERSFNETLRWLMHLFFLTCTVIFVGQQWVLFYQQWGLEQQAFIRAEKLYREEECQTYNGSSQARINQCILDNITINTWPITSALLKVVSSWNSCVYMPCSEIFLAVVSHWHYKILFILASLAVASYIFQFINLIVVRGSKADPDETAVLLKKQKKLQLQLLMAQNENDALSLQKKRSIRCEEVT